MYHEWECPDCGHELHHECEITEGAVPQGDSEYCGDPDDPLCGPDLGKPWCAYHGGTDDAVKQGLIEEWDVAGYVPCNCLGPSHSNDCPNWELPH